MAAVDTLRDALYGNPPSTTYPPSREGVLTAFTELAQAIRQITLTGLISVIKATKADLDADLAHDADTYAIVWDDATDANNDIYVKTGASGAGAWTNLGLLHSIVTGLTGNLITDLNDAVAAFTMGIANAAITATVASTWDTLTAYSENVWRYVEAGAGTTSYAIIHIPDHAAGTIIQWAYRINRATGAVPFARLAYTDGGSGAIKTLKADGLWHLQAFTVDAAKTANSILVGATGAASGYGQSLPVDGDDRRDPINTLGPITATIWAMLLDIMSMHGRETISDQRLKEWALTGAYQLAADPWNGTTFVAVNVEWVDGSTGVKTPVTINTATNTVDEWTLTHQLSGKTVTQPLITRDPVTGRATTIPMFTISGGS